MPKIDVSQSSFRALVNVAHRHGMSVDQFIRHSFVPEADAQDPDSPVSAEMVAVTELSATPSHVEADVLISPAGPVRKAATAGQRTTPDSSFEALWERIERGAGKVISTKRGKGFTYEVEAGYLAVRESGTRVPQSQFRKALGQWPARGPSTMRGVYASTVVWAVLSALAPDGPELH